MTDPTEVIVIGAGIAGLTAAERLVAQGKTVRILEARDRVGGRTEGGSFRSGTSIELGGQWVGPTQDEVLALASRLGLETFTVHDEGASILVANGERTLSDDDTFGLGAQAGLAFANLVEHIDELATGIDLAAPWNSPAAVELDALTAGQWLDLHCDDELVREFTKLMMATIFAADVDEFSALHMLFYLASGGGLHRMMITIGGAQESRIRGGTHQLSERLAANLGARVQLSEPVLEVTAWEEDSVEYVTVRTSRDTYQANQVIVALPPVMASRIHYNPPLPANRDKAQAQMLAGDVIKFQIEYETPFWRAAGLSGTALSLEHRVSLTYDNCVPDSERGILVAFVEGRHARELNEVDEQTRADRVLADLAELYGADALNPTELLQRNWSEEQFTRGCYGGRFGNGLWTTVGAHLAKPCGRIHWAGAETSAVWNGYIDGAIRSGQRAADEVLSAAAVG